MKNIISKITALLNRIFVELENLGAAASHAKKS